MLIRDPYDLGTRKEGWFTMSVSAETYIVISLMFAVFAAVAAVGTSVVLGAGFERLRAGFEVVRRQSGFFADAIYKLDQRTQKLDEEQAKMKSGVYNIGERMDRVEKQVTFMGDAVSSIEQRILQGTPAQQPTQEPVRMQPVYSDRPSMQPKTQSGWIKMPEAAMAPRHQAEAPEPLAASLMREMPEQAPRSMEPNIESEGGFAGEMEESPVGLTTLLSRYFTGEQSGSGKGVVYH